MRRVSYDAIARNPGAIPGMTFDQFIERVIQELTGWACTGTPECLHCAAHAVRAFKRLVEHPDDCPECAAIHARDRSDPGV